MKVATMTQDGYENYGNVLQRYALQYILRLLNIDVDSIWYSKYKFLPKTFGQWGWKEPIKFIFNWRNYRSKIFNGELGEEMVRQGKIEEWCNRYIHIRKVSKDLSELSGEYDYFVVGSDQVWKPNFKGLEMCFLFFVPCVKRISYAASISSPDLPKAKISMYKKGFTEMSYISMREQQGADMVKKISGRDVPVHVDPTLLLTPDDWRKVSRQPAWFHGEDYILTYFLGKRPEVVARLERQTGLKVVNLLDENVYEHYVTGPDEFLWAIEHAKLVYTDSFHGTVFSILFRTPFVVCNRIGNAVEEKMGSRIDTLLGYFGLEARRGTKENGYAIENPLSEPNWSQVDEVLARERKRSDEYLRQALKVDEVQGL